MENSNQKQEQTEQPHYVEGKDGKYIQEGGALIKLTNKIINKEKNIEIESEVFYNPVQKFNRDLTILVIKTYYDNLKQQDQNFPQMEIVDLLSASGLRSIRYLKELGDIVSKVYANDISSTSHQIMKENFESNQIDSSKIELSMKDANEFLLGFRQQFGQKRSPNDFMVIDIDPYGSSIPFMDSVFQAANENCLICATCTDSRVWAGHDIQKCFYMYGATKAKVASYNENGIRIILNSFNRIAVKYGKSIRPLLSIQSEFYIRIFFIVNQSTSECNKAILKAGLVFNCDYCTNYHVHPFAQIKDQTKAKIKKLDIPSQVCDICESPFRINGPVWLDNVNDLDFVQKLSQNLESEQISQQLGTKKKIRAMLSGIFLEQNYQQNPLGLQIDILSKFMKCQRPSNLMLEAALNSLGYSYETSYINPKIFKFNCPNEVVFDLIKAYKLKYAGQENLLKNINQDSPNYKFLTKPLKFHPDYDYKILEKKEKVPRFFPNPAEWGPKKKAGVRKIKELQIEHNDHDQENNLSNQYQHQDKQIEGNAKESIEKKIKGEL